MDRYTVEPLASQFAIRDNNTGKLVMDGLIPVMRSTRESAQTEADFFQSMRDQKNGES